MAMMRCRSQFNFAIDGVWTHSSRRWSPHSTELQSPDHAGEEEDDAGEEEDDGDHAGEKDDHAGENDEEEHYRIVFRIMNVMKMAMVGCYKLWRRQEKYKSNRKYKYKR